MNEELVLFKYSFCDIGFTYFPCLTCHIMSGLAKDFTIKALKTLKYL